MDTWSSQQVCQLSVGVEDVSDIILTTRIWFPALSVCLRRIIYYAITGFPGSVWVRNVKNLPCLVALAASSMILGEGDREMDCQLAQACNAKGTLDLEFVQAIMPEGADVPGWLSFGWEGRGVTCASVWRVHALKGLTQSVFKMTDLIQNLWQCENDRFQG